MSACDPLIQAERRFKAQCLNQRRWDLFPCRGPVVPCRTLHSVSATCKGTVKRRCHRSVQLPKWAGWSCQKQPFRYLPVGGSPGD